MRMQRYERAVESYWRSLLLRPHYAATHLNLGYALKDSVRLEEAIAEWEQTLRLATRRQGRNWLRREIDRACGMLRGHSIAWPG